MAVGPTPDSPVLSTLNQDGSRRWLNPRLSRGPLLHARRILAWVLIAIFTLLPHVRWQGKPFVLLDLPARRFTIAFFTFLPTDTLLLALFLVAVIVGIALATALLGRVWCGWMCPQTVYMEFVYRPVERLFDGPPTARHRGGKHVTALRRAGKFLVFLAISMFLAHTFLAYFVGVEALARWVRLSPVEHPVPFVLMVFVTALMMFDFGYFREQMCIVACPYGRFQSVMLDRDSLIISYDRRRGEPRGKPGATVDGVPVGDCVDCNMCADTCPTGIDIRNGLQLECIACTQCIDACNSMMDHLKRPRGLVRFSSQNRMEGNPSRILRPRVILYPSVLAVLLVALVTVFARKQTADATLLRGLGAPFTQLAPNEVTNQVRVKLTNRGEQEAVYRVEIGEQTPARLSDSAREIRIPAGESRTTPVMITAPLSAFRNGRYDVALRISDGRTYRQELSWRLLGPQDAVATSNPSGAN